MSAGSAGNLAQAAKNLSNEWQQTLAHWHDAKSQEFQRNYLDAVPGHVSAAIAVMEEIEALLKKIRSECE